MAIKTKRAIARSNLTSDVSSSLDRKKNENKDSTQAANACATSYRPATAGVYMHTVRPAELILPLL